MVEAPGTAPGSEWFITQAIYCHSRRADNSNIGLASVSEKSRLENLHTKSDNISLYKRITLGKTRVMSVHAGVVSAQ